MLFLVITSLFLVPSFALEHDSTYDRTLGCGCMEAWHNYTGSNNLGRGGQSYADMSCELYNKSIECIGSALNGWLKDVYERKRHEEMQLQCNDKTTWICVHKKKKELRLAAKGLRWFCRENDSPKYCFHGHRTTPNPQDMANCKERLCGDIMKRVEKRRKCEKELWGDACGDDGKRFRHREQQIYANWLRRRYCGY